MNSRQPEATTPPAVHPHIHALSAYAPPWTGLDRKQYLRLDLNENTQPPPACVTEALKALLDAGRLQMYPEYDEFLAQLAVYTNADSEQLILTNGSDQAIDIILRAFLSVGDEMLIAQPEFPVFAQVAHVLGVRIKGVPFSADLSFPHQALQAAITQRTRLIVLINPNNPTGTPIELEQIEQIVRDHPTIPVLVDEAYYELTGETCCNLLERYPNLIIIRTFSKAFAMAGLRLGYALAHPGVIRELHKIRGPFDVNSCAVAAASAQLAQPEAWQAYVKTVMTVSKPLLEQFLTQAGVKYYPSASHFMLVQPDDRDRAVQYLKEHGILVRPMVAPTIRNTFRLCLGMPDEMRRFIACYRDYLQAGQV